VIHASAVRRTRRFLRLDANGPAAIPARRWRALAAVLVAAAVVRGPLATGTLDALGADQVAVAPALLEAQWPASWIASADGPARDASVQHFRRVITLPDVPAHVVVHVSADNRYILHVNGRLVGRGPARGDLVHWSFESYDLAPLLAAGPNVIAATVWNFGVDAPMAQMSRRTGFLLQADDPAHAALNTGPDWLAAVERGHEVNPAALDEIRARHFYYAAAPGERRDGRVFDWTWDGPDGGAGGWAPAFAIGRGHPASISRGPGWMRSPEGWLLVPDTMPSLDLGPDTVGRIVRAEGAAPADRPIVVPPGRSVTLLYDRGEIVNAYPRLTVSGGRDAVVRLTYTEALYDASGAKGNRDEIAGKTVVGVYDEFVADGGQRRTFEPLWFRSWRYLELRATAGAEPLRIDALESRRTGFPFERRARFESDDDELARIWEIGWRTARLAAHETYMDAPYWEQLQYVGDTRIDALISYAVANEDRLARRALELFDWSRLSEGITQSRYPTAEVQYIPPYALFFVSMVHDFWLYRGDEDVVRARLPATRAVLDWFARHERPDGLLDRLPYWVHGDTGTVLDETIQGEDGGSAAITFQLAGALRDAAALEDALGDSSRAAAYRARAARAADAAGALFDPVTGLVADTPARQTWGHPVNIFALLYGALSGERRAAVLSNVISVARHPAGRSASGGAGGAWPLSEMPSASYYFRFYLARALEASGAQDEYVGLLDPWRRLLPLGLSTWPEHPAPSRSDCHAWSAHPTLDLLRIVAGVRPIAPGFSRVRIAPGLGPLDHVRAAHPSPLGDVEVDVTRAGAGIDASITLPPGMTGEFAWHGTVRALVSGRQQVHVD
jgi:alpha-L-rhamnosidase